MKWISLFLVLSIHFASGQQNDLSDYPIQIPDAQEEDEEWNSDLSLIDLEEGIDDFVLKTKKIIIPECPTAFNPSLVRWNDSLLMSFRIRHPATGATDQIGLVWLDDEFSLLSKTKVLEFRGVANPYPTMQQDPRLVAVGEKLYIVFSNSIEGISRDIRRMYFAELHIEGEDFYIENPECLTTFDGAADQRWEKNWIPFDCGGTLLMVYSLFPHNIVMPIPGTSCCKTVGSTFSNIQWEWGVLRGGTPALALNESEYLSFFHSSIPMATTHSNGKKIQHYFIGAYTFSRAPPFSIARMSRKPIIGKRFYRGPAHKTWKPLRVVFPCGYIMDEEHVWIVYGRQDHELWVAKLDKKGLLESLVDCNGKG